MKISLKFIISIFLILLLLTTCVNAANINMNLIANDISNSTENTSNEFDLNENAISNDVSNNIDSSATETSNSVSNPRVSSTTVSEDNNFLTAENILSVMIIVIGILLIFLAIAILVRFK